MSGEVFIPGDDLERAADNMKNVLDLLNNGYPKLPIDEALGTGSDTYDAGDDFDQRWSDGITQLNEEAGDIQDALKKTLDAFSNTDNQAAANLTSSSDGQNS
jgi:uncharacterized protein YukE